MKSELTADGNLILTTETKFETDAIRRLVEDWVTFPVSEPKRMLDDPPMTGHSVGGCGCSETEGPQPTHDPSLADPPVD